MSIKVIKYESLATALNEVEAALLNLSQFSDGEDGRNNEFRKSATHLQYRLVGDLVWIDLLPLTDIKGVPGDVTQAYIDLAAQIATDAQNISDDRNETEGFRTQSQGFAAAALQSKDNAEGFAAAALQSKDDADTDALAVWNMLDMVETKRAEVQTRQADVVLKHGEVDADALAVSNMLVMNQTIQSDITTKHGEVSGWRNAVQGWHAQIQTWFNTISGWHAQIQTWQGQVAADVVTSNNHRVNAEASAAAANAVVTGASTARPSIRPTLLVDFANADRVDPRLIVTRNSIGTCFDERGFRVTRQANQIRYEHDPVTGRRLGALKEAAATNLYAHSGAISAANGWSINSPLATTLNDAEGLDGTISAERITIAATGLCHFSRTAPAVIGQNYTRWGVFREGTMPRILLETSVAHYNVGITQVTTFNLTTGVITGFTTRAFMFLIRDGWYICGRTDEAAATSIAGSWFLDVYGSSTNVGAFLHVDGMQIELGSFPTSYIPTGATAVTRAAETWVMPNVEDIIKPGEGSFYAEGITGYGSVSGGHSIIFASTGNSLSQSIIVGQRATALNRTAIGFTPTASDIQFNLLNALVGIGQRVRYSIGYRTNDIAGSYNGGAVQVDTVATIPTINTLEIGGINANGMSAWAGIVVCVAYYPRRLPNAELQALTASGLLAGKDPNQLPAVADLGSAAFVQLNALLAMRARQEVSVQGTGANHTVTVRRPYPFGFVIVDATGSTIVTSVQAVCLANTNYPLTFNAPVGTLLTYAITPIIL